MPNAKLEKRGMSLKNSSPDSKADFSDIAKEIDIGDLVYNIGRMAYNIGYLNYLSGFV